MISARCECGVAYSVGESDLGTPVTCRQCGRVLRCACAEPLEPGAGAADFDARLLVEEGPSDVGVQILLGGVPDVEVGKLPERHVRLQGNRVSRLHCRLSRLDFGPSRWKLVDNQSTNGLFVNGRRVTEQELRHGDEVQVGEYRLRYLSDAERPAPAAAVPASVHAPAAAGGSYARAGSLLAQAGGALCPSCDQPLAPGARICVRCGIYAATGRPLITAQGLDEDALHARAETWIRFVSLLIPLTPMPMPLASEAYGGRKPYAIWTIACLTTLASIVFFAAQHGPSAADTKNLMLWNPRASNVRFSFDSLTGEQLNRIVAKMEPADRQELARAERALRNEGLSAVEARRRALRGMLSEAIDELEARANQRGTFAWYQLLTHALLHDTSDVLSFILHLGGNMLFLLVFGTRVNSLIGNVATAVAYPLLAVSAAAVHLATLKPTDVGAMLGASGAIMGLAGMYLILFPVHRVYCAMWVRIRFRLFAKIFTLRGFWVLLIYFAYDVAMQALSRGEGGGVAHWAHIGGFTAGVVLALAILLSRQFNCRGGDLLSVVLGRHAWALIGKPSRWGDRTPAPPAVAMVAAVPRHPVYGSVPQRL